MSLSSLVLSNETRRGNVPPTVVVYVIRDERCSLDHPLGDAIEVLIRREDAERSSTRCAATIPSRPARCGIEERELDAGRTSASHAATSAEKARSRDCTTSGGAYRAMDTPGHREEELPRSLRGGATGMNTTKLIAHWTMSGEDRDVTSRFGATADIGAVIAGNKSTPEPTVAASSFLIKGTNEESWRTIDG